MRRDAAPLLGSILGGRFRMIQLLASGGAGDVYLAEPTSGHGAGRASPRARVAVKVLRGEHRERNDLVDRFHREADAIGVIRHDNVLALLEPPSEANGVLFYVMELLVGLDLADTLAYSRSLGAARAARIAAGVAAGLSAAHAAGVVHRDVKPENIFLVHAADGREAVKLIDFGFAWMRGDDQRGGRRVTFPGTVVGTPEYMAPEQAQGGPASPWADIYSLGVVLYEMIAGRVPFTGGYPAVARRHAEEPPPPLDAACSPELEAVVMRALAKDPRARFESMADLERALARAPEVS